MTEFKKIVFKYSLAQSVYDAAMERVEASEAELHDLIDAPLTMHSSSTQPFDERLATIDAIAKNRIDGFVAAVDVAYKIESSEPARPFDELQWDKEADMRADLDRVFHSGDGINSEEWALLEAKYPKMGDKP